MSRALAIIGIFGLVGLVLAGAYFGLFTIGATNPDSTATLPISFSAIDKLAGSQDATTSAVAIYRSQGGRPVLQETVTMNAASVDSTLDYTTSEELLFKIYDATDTSVCTQYLTWVVPFADAAAIYNGKFQCVLQFVDKGDTTKDIAVTEGNGTAIAASATVDCSNSGYDSAFATWEFTVRTLDSDKGYVNTYNFLKGYGNYHYLVLKISGTGWDRVVFESNVDTFERNNIRYAAIKLSDADLTRDLQTDGTYEPDGFYRTSMIFDLTAITSGDSVTFAYEYRWYADWQNFKVTGSWGSDSSATTETLTIVP